MRAMKLSANTGWMSGEAADMAYGLLSGASLRTLVAARGDPRNPDPMFLPYVEVMSDPPSMTHCKLLSRLGAGDVEVSGAAALRALDGTAEAALSRMIAHGPTASRLVALVRLRDLEEKVRHRAGPCPATLAAPTDALLDALAATVASRGVAREPPPDGRDYLSHTPLTFWTTVLPGLHLLPASASGEDAAIMMNALCSLQAVHVLITFLAPLPSQACSDDPRAAQRHRIAARLLDAGLGDEAMSWASSNMYPALPAAVAAAHAMPDARCARLRGPPLPPGCAMVGDAPLASRGRVAALQLASRLVQHGVLYDARSAARFADFATAAVHIATACMADAGPGSMPAVLAGGVRVRAAAAQLMTQLVSLQLMRDAATLAALAPAQARLAAVALAAGALRRCIAVSELAPVSIPIRAGAFGATAFIARSSLDAAGAAPLTDAVAAQLAAAAAAAASGRRGWPGEDETPLLHGAFAALKVLASYTELRGTPMCSDAAKAQLRACDAALRRSGSYLAHYPTEILAILAAEPTESLLARNRELHAGPLSPGRSSTADERACAACGERPPALKLCAGCGDARYCGAACQRAHWQEHKAACRAAAAAAAAAAAQ